MPAADFDPVDRLAGREPPFSAFWRPGVSEQVSYSAHTQVTVPALQARLVFWLRFGQVFGVLFGITLIWGGITAFSNGYDIPGYVALGAVVLMIAAAWASSKPYALLIERMEGEIVDPHRDSDARMIMGDYHERMMQAQQQRPVAPPALRVEVNNGGGQWRFADLPAPSCTALIWFARDVMNDLTDGALAERTAIHHGFTRFQWQDLRDRLLQMQAVEWKHPSEPRQGVVLTDLGKRVMNEIARTPLAEARR